MTSSLAGFRAWRHSHGRSSHVKLGVSVSLVIFVDYILKADTWFSSNNHIGPLCTLRGGYYHPPLRKSKHNRKVVIITHKIKIILAKIFFFKVRITGEEDFFPLLKINPIRLFAFSPFSYFSCPKSNYLEREKNWK